MPYLQGYLVSPTSLGLFLGCFAVTACLTVLIVGWARWTDLAGGSPYGRNRRNPPPLFGGLGIALPFLAVLLACATEMAGMPRALGDQRRDFLLLFLGGCIILTLGLLDDARSLRTRQKLMVEVLAGLLVALSGNGVSALNIPLAGLVNLEGMPGLGTLLAVLWVVGLIKAVRILF